MNQEQKQNEENKQGISFSEFLESVPPNKIVRIEPFNCDEHGESYKFKLPVIQLYCSSEFCSGARFFESEESNIYLRRKGRHELEFVEYSCKNCQQTHKIYAIAITLTKEEEPQGIAFKFGEFPSFGPPTPPKLIEIIGPDKELYLMGRRCENQGLGIGAYVYYRRVVENQKNRIFDKIISVVQKASPKDEVIKELQDAKNETQFSKAVESIKRALPESLLIEKHNPLTILYRALSEGVHDKSDRECLELAGNVRVVLTELAGRLAQALKDEAELKNAVSKLMTQKKQKANKASPHT